MSSGTDAQDTAATRYRNIALGVFALALLLRLRGLLSFPFDQDELYTIVESTRLLDSPLRPGIEGRPLYYLLQHPLLAALPQSPFWVRLPALLAGIAGVWVTWLLGRRICGGVSGLAAMVLISVSPWHLYASGMARYWSLVYLAAAGFWLAYLRARETEMVKHYAMALLPLTVGALSHPTFLFPLPTALLAMHCIGIDGRIGWRWPSRQAWVGLWLPFAAVLVVWWVILQSLDSVASVRNFDGRGLVPTLKLLPAMVQWMTPATAAAAVAGSVLAWRRGGDVRQWSLVGGGGALGAAILLFSASIITDVYADYGMALLPFAFSLGGILVSELADAASGSFSRIATAGITLLLILGGVLPSTVSHLLDGTRFDYRPAFASIRAVAPERLVVITPLIQRNQYAPELRAAQLEARGTMLDSLLAAERNIWLVLSVQRSGVLADGSGVIRDWSRRHCSVIDSWERPRLDYRTYRVELQACAAEDAAGTGPAMPPISAR